MVLCAVMIRGRHRCLPMSLDRAIMLPHEFDEKEESPLADTDVAVEVLHRQAETNVEWPQETGESQTSQYSSSGAQNDSKQN